jgi:diguanylate cyclase (GGDEF)-like protein
VHAVVTHDGEDLIVERAGGPISIDETEVERSVLASGSRMHVVSTTFRYQLVDANEEAALTTVFESSVRDGLTGAFNLRHLASMLEGEVAYVRRTKEALALLSLDVVDMRLINATRGHAGGDEALKHVVERVRALAGDAPVFRSGGDELMLVLRDGAVAGADALAARIVAAVAEAPVACGDSAVAVAVRAAVVVAADDETGASLIERGRRAVDGGR